MSFGHSMTTPGHPPGCGSAAARAFITAWRHIVTVFRHQGARNAAWMWAVSADRPSACPAGWGWPGESYVTWIRINGHYSRAHGKFASAFGRTIEQVRRFSRKPVILSVTSLGPSAGKFQRIVSMFTGLQRYSAYGLIWVAESQSPQPTATIDGSTVDTVAFRLGVSRLQPARFTRPSS
jgi:hypothetical protein